jgi:hypothetical protein
MSLPNAITAASVKIRFPVFRNVEDALIEFAIEEANLSVDPSVFDDWYLMAFLYYVAHIVMRAMQTLAGGAGQVLRSVSVGGEISYSYETVPPPTLADHTDLATTPFGVRFLEICSLKIPAVGLV